MQEKEELIEIYNEHLESIGIKKKKEVNEKKDIVKTAIIILFNEKNQIFMTEPKKSIWPDKISCSCIALVKHNESAIETAKETLKKELNIEAKLIPFEEKYYNLNGIKRILSFFYAKAKSQPRINKKEIKDGKWVEQDEIENIIKHDDCIPPFIIAYNILKNKFGK